MSVHHYVGGTGWTSGGTEVSVEFPTFPELTTAARGGEMGSGTVAVVDPTGTLDLRGWNRYRAEEDECLARPLIFPGFIKGKKIRRGAEGPIGPGRVWECEVSDLNLLAHLRAYNTGAANRPAETFAERMAWFGPTITQLVPDVTTWVITGHDSVALDAADYRRKYRDDVLNDIASQTGWDWFIAWNYSGAEPGLFLNLRDAVINTSAISVTNFAGETDHGAGVYEVSNSSNPEDATVDRDPDEVYSEVDLVYVGGIIVRRDTLTATEFIDRAYVYESSRIGRLSTAEAVAAQFLADHSIEKDTITIPVRLPKEEVNLVAAGERIAVHLEHLSFATGTDYGGDDFVYVRIARRTISQVELDFYDLMLSCTNFPKSASAAGGPPPEIFPHQTSCAPGSGDLVQAATATGFTNSITVGLASPATAGNLLVMGVSLRQQAFTGDPVGWTALAEGEVDPFENNSKLYYRTAEAGDQTWTWVPGGGSGDASAVIAEFVGGVAFVDSAELVSTDPYTGPSAPGAAVTPTSGSISTIVGFWGYKSDRVTGPTAGSGWTLTGTVKAGGVTRCAMAHKVVSAASGSYTPTIVAPDSQVVFDNHSYGEQSAAFSCDETDNPPVPGQWVGISPPEAVTLTGGAGTTRFSFADGSLRVFYDIVEQTAAIVSYDGAAKTFQMPSQPPLGTQVFVQYQGR